MQLNAAILKIIQYLSMEKKKIVPKSKLNANAQEELLKKLQQNTEESINSQQLSTETTITENKTEILQQSTANTVVDIQNTVNIEKLGKIQRITVDMPIELYGRMKIEVEANGQTIKGFIVSLVRTHFKNVE